MPLGDVNLLQVHKASSSLFGLKRQINSRFDGFCLAPHLCLLPQRSFETLDGVAPLQRLLPLPELSRSANLLGGPDWWEFCVTLTASRRQRFYRPPLVFRGIHSQTRSLGYGAPYFVGSATQFIQSTVNCSRAAIRFEVEAVLYFHRVLLRCPLTLHIYYTRHFR